MNRRQIDESMHRPVQQSKMLKVERRHKNPLATKDGVSLVATYRADG